MGLIAPKQEPTTIVTPAVKPEEAPRADQQDVRVSFEGQEYQFPSDTTDDEVMEFMNTMTFDSETAEEEPPEPLRETDTIKRDEGVKKDKDGKHVSYMDSVRTKQHPKGVLTGGRGHQLTKEEKKLYPKGTIIPDEVVADWFKEDLTTADRLLTEILEEKATRVPDEVYDILLNMTFNLGKGTVPRGEKKGTGILGFKDMWAAVLDEEWGTAAVEMEDSKWFKQVKNRAVRLVNRMASLAPAKNEPQGA